MRLSVNESVLPPLHQFCESVSPLISGFLALREHKLSLESRVLRKGPRTPGETELSENKDIA
jgi:hypothetical protein